MISSIDRFISSTSNGELVEHPGVFFSRCEYSIDEFEFYYFNELAISVPKSIFQSVKKRQAEYLCGRYCANQVLETMGINNVNIAIGAKREPLWPKGIKGAISHTDCSAVTLVTNKEDIHGLGIDQEWVLTSKVVHEIKEQIINSNEQNVISSCQLDNDVAFSVVFSGKESFFKAMFPLYGQYFDFSAVSLVTLDGNNEHGHFTFELGLTFNDKFRHGLCITGHYRIYQTTNADCGRQQVETFIVLE